MLPVMGSHSYAQPNQSIMSVTSERWKYWWTLYWYFCIKYYLQVIVNLLRQLYPRLSILDSTSAVAFHELVTSIVMVLPSLPFPLELPLEVSAPRPYDDDAEVWRNKYYSYRNQKCNSNVFIDIPYLNY